MLTLVPDDEHDSTWSFNRYFTYHFFEDESVGDKFCLYKNDNENYMNLMHWIFVGELFYSSRILVLLLSVLKTEIVNLVKFISFLKEHNFHKAHHW